MSYLPVGLNLGKLRVLLVGGGEIAYFKYTKLLEFSPEKLTVISKNFNQDFQKIRADRSQFVEREYRVSDLFDVDVVIVAIDDQNLQREIYHQCQERKILCNCVDLLDCCDFIFTAYIKKDDLVISINTNGVVPGLSAVLKNHIEKFIPSNIEQILNSLKEYRNSLAPGKRRMKLVREKAESMLSESDYK